MEINLLTPEMLRLRGKQVTLLINPMPTKLKSSVDALLFYNRAPQDFNESSFEGNKLVIDGAGEYEVGGVKIEGKMNGSAVYYNVIIDGIDVTIGKASVLSRIKGDMKECQMALIESDTLLDQGVAAAINPSILLFYGVQAEENIKSLGKENSNPVNKFAITREKLPTDTQIVLLQ